MLRFILLQRFKDIRQRALQSDETSPLPFAVEFDDYDDDFAVTDTANDTV